MTTYIYGLVDPRTREIRYVGQTIDCNQRLKQHLDDACTTAKGSWISELKSCDLKPIMSVLDKADDRFDASHKEAWWIWLGRQRGWNLTNSALPLSSEEKLPEILWLYFQKKFHSIALEDDLVFYLTRRGFFKLTFFLGAFLGIFANLSAESRFLDPRIVLGPGSGHLFLSSMVISSCLFMFAAVVSRRKTFSRQAQEGK